MFTSAKKEVLIELVKLTQMRRMVGERGSWKEFLKVYDKKLGASLSDPSRRSVEALVAFLKTFTREDDLKLLKKVLRYHANRDAVEDFKNASPKYESAEQRLVRMTVEHPLYITDYSFPSHEEGWLVTKCSNKSKALQSTAMIAIDCEMVLCKDGTDAVVKVCVVDRNLQVKLDEFVNPNKEIVDYRTDITGISASDLKGVTCSLKDVQKSLRKLLSHGTILVGHGLNNDLQVLKLDHARVIDTSYIYKYENESAYRRPSLSFLCKAILGFDLRETGKAHDCLDDALAAMRLVLAKLDGKTGDFIPEEARELESAKLLLHRIPKNIPSKDLKNVIPGDFTIKVKTKKHLRDTYSALAMFKNQKDAEEAFESIEGDEEKDWCGRPQKLVKFELDSGITGTLYVCNAIREPNNKRMLDDVDNPVPSKKAKTDGKSNVCEVHLKEIERLKQEIRQRDAEIKGLEKLIVAAVIKHGL